MDDENAAQAVTPGRRTCVLRYTYVSIELDGQLPVLIHRYGSTPFLPQSVTARYESDSGGDWTLMRVKVSGPRMLASGKVSTKAEPLHQSLTGDELRRGFASDAGPWTMPDRALEVLRALLAGNGPGPVAVDDLPVLPENYDTKGVFKIIRGDV